MQKLQQAIQIPVAAVDVLTLTGQTKNKLMSIYCHLLTRTALTLTTRGRNLISKLNLLQKQICLVEAEII